MGFLKFPFAHPCAAGPAKGAVSSIKYGTSPSKISTSANAKQRPVLRRDVREIQSKFLCSLHELTTTASHVVSETCTRRKRTFCFHRLCESLETPITSNSRGWDGCGLSVLLQVILEIKSSHPYFFDIS